MQSRVTAMKHEIGAWRKPSYLIMEACGRPILNEFGMKLVKEKASLGIPKQVKPVVGGTGFVGPERFLIELKNLTPETIRKLCELLGSAGVKYEYSLKHPFPPDQWIFTGEFGEGVDALAN